MKKRIMKLALLSISLSLFSCTSNENNPSVSSNETLKSEETSSVNESVSEETSSSKESVSEENSSSEEKPTAWSESDLQKMSTYLNGYTCLPFPIGFSHMLKRAGQMKKGRALLSMTINLATFQKAMASNLFLPLLFSMEREPNMVTIIIVTIIQLPTPMTKSWCKSIIIRMLLKFLLGMKKEPRFMKPSHMR